MGQLSRQTLKDVYDDGWPDPDPQWRPVSISFTNRLLRVIDKKVDDSNCEYDNRSALVRAALYDWLEQEVEDTEKLRLALPEEGGRAPTASERG